MKINASMCNPERLAVSELAFKAYPAIASEVCLKNTRKNILFKARKLHC